MWKTAHLLAVGGVAACFLATAAQSQVAGSRHTHAAPPVTFQDSVGEDPASADITSVVVSNDDNGLITFVVNIPNRPQLTNDMRIALFVDTDLNATNGAGPNFDGAELMIELAQNDLALARWNGSQFDFSAPSPSSLSFVYRAGATFRIKAADLGATTFNFWVATLAGEDPDVHVDFAPDADRGTWPYQVNVASLRLVTQRFGIYPTRPKAPGQLNAYLLVRRLDTGAQVRSGSVTCVAKIGSKTVKRIDARFYKGTVNCNWALAKWAVGKTLKGSITVTFQGTKIIRNFSVRIR